MRVSISYPWCYSISPEARMTVLEQEAHQNVAKWTRRVNIFEKDFIFVPLCEQVLQPSAPRSLTVHILADQVPGARSCTGRSPSL